MFTWAEEVPPLVRIVVGVDPAGSTRVGSDETGLVVAGLSYTGHIFVLEDCTDRYSPAKWAAKAHSLYEKWEADAIVAEKNYGGDMVRHTLETSGYSGARIITVDSRRGKAIRAEPIVARYEKKLVTHAGKPGDLAELEDELCTWVPGVSQSPNRLDALVHASTSLLKNLAPAAIADPNKLLRRHLRVVS
jgi:phage terminase large subunit-like protein